MAIQDKVTIDHEKGYAGQIVDLQLHNKISITNDTEEVWGYGTPVNYPGTEEFAGLIVRTITDANYNEELGAGVYPKRTATVMTDGVMWVVADKEVEVGTPYTVGEVEIPNAKYVSAGAVGELVKVKLTIGG